MFTYLVLYSNDKIDPEKQLKFELFADNVTHCLQLAKEALKTITGTFTIHHASQDPPK